MYSYTASSGGGGEGRRRNSSYRRRDSSVVCVCYPPMCLRCADVNRRSRAWRQGRRQRRRRFLLFFRGTPRRLRSTNLPVAPVPLRTLRTSRPASSSYPASPWQPRSVMAGWSWPSRVCVFPRLSTPRRENIFQSSATGLAGAPPLTF